MQVGGISSIDYRYPTVGKKQVSDNVQYMREREKKFLLAILQIKREEKK